MISLKRLFILGILACLVLMANAQTDEPPPAGVETSNNTTSENTTDTAEPGNDIYKIMFLIIYK